MGAPIGLINAGSFRSDSVEPPGNVDQAMIDKILPFQDEAVLVDLHGDQLVAILENSVSQYPLLDGRFLQVGGISFVFDPRKTPLKRIVPGSVKVMDDTSCMKPIDGGSVYRCAMKTFIFQGKDGFPKGNSEQILERSTTSIRNMVASYFSKDSENIEDTFPTISPKLEDRIVCVCPDSDLLKAYSI